MNATARTNQHDPDPVYTPPEAARYLRKTDGTLANWRSQGRGPRYCRCGSSVVYRLSDLRSFLDANVVDPEVT
jgi:hypothetical protein